MTKPNKKTHKVTQDNVIQFKGSENECWVYILKHQSQSVDYATTFGGWKIEPFLNKSED